MGVIRTDRWLRDYLKKGKNVPMHHRFFLQFETILQPIYPYFRHLHPREFHEMLLLQGMFLPGIEDEEFVEAIVKTKIWEVVKKEYEALRNEWEGPEAFIYIFPVNERNELIMNELGGKTGISFKEKVFLFVSHQTKLSGIRALLTHEYHHTCRLHQLNRDERELTLLDSIIVEGLAEFAVYERFGASELGKWTNMYHKEELQLIWEQIFDERLFLRGKDYHSIYLYGSESRQIPQWAGYALGYELVKSCRLSTKQLLKLDSEEILKKSRFYKKS